MLISNKVARAFHYNNNTKSKRLLQKPPDKFTYFGKYTFSRRIEKKFPHKLVQLHTPDIGRYYLYIIT